MRGFQTCLSSLTCLFCSISNPMGIQVLSSQLGNKICRRTDHAKPVMTATLTVFPAFWLSTQTCQPSWNLPSSANLHSRLTEHLEGRHANSSSAFRVHCRDTGDGGVLYILLEDYRHGAHPNLETSRIIRTEYLCCFRVVSKGILWMSLIFTSGQHTLAPTALVALTAKIDPLHLSLSLSLSIFP